MIDVGMSLNCVLVANISVRPAEILLSVENSEWQMIASAGKDKYKQYIHVAVRQRSSQHYGVAALSLFSLRGLLWLGLFPSIQSASLFLSPFSKDNRPECQISKWKKRQANRTQISKQ